MKWSVHPINISWSSPLRFYFRTQCDCSIKGERRCGGVSPRTECSQRGWGLGQTRGRRTPSAPSVTDPMTPFTIHHPMRTSQWAVSHFITCHNHKSPRKWLGCSFQVNEMVRFCLLSGGLLHEKPAIIKVKMCNFTAHCPHKSQLLCFIVKVVSFYLHSLLLYLQNAGIYWCFGFRCFGLTHIRLRIFSIPVIFLKYRTVYSCYVGLRLWNMVGNADRCRLNWVPVVTERMEGTRFISGNVMTWLGSE